MSLINKMTNPGPSVYYEQQFRNVFEDHLSFILNNRASNIYSATVDPNTAARFAGDFRGLMLSLGIFPFLHWYNMRINGYTSTSDYDGSQLTLDLLNDKVIVQLAKSYKTSRKN